MKNRLYVIRNKSNILNKCNKLYTTYGNKFSQAIGWAEINTVDVYQKDRKQMWGHSGKACKCNNKRKYPPNSAKFIYNGAILQRKANLLLKISEYFYFVTEVNTNIGNLSNSIV